MKLKQLGGSLAIVLSLALGIGAAVSALSLATAFNSKSFPFRDAGVVMLTETNKGKEMPGSSIPDLNDLQKGSQFLSGMAAYSTYLGSAGVNAWFLGDQDPRKVTPTLVTANFLDLLGVRPVVGASFNNSELPQIMLGEALWQEAFGSDPGIAGKRVQLNGKYYEIAGVLPRDFDLPIGTQVWVKERLLDPAYSPFRTNYSFTAIGVLRPGISSTQAQAQADAVTQNLQRTYPESNHDIAFLVTPLSVALNSRMQSVIRIFYGLSLSLLCIVWANTFALILARLLGRRADLSVRLALGAPQRSLFAETIRSTATMAVAGCALGAALALFFLAKLQGLGGQLIPRYIHLELNWPALAVCVAATLITALLVAYAAALRVWRTPPHDVLRQIGTTSTPGRKSMNPVKVLLGADAAITTAILCCAVVFVQQLVAMKAWSLGIRPASVQDMETALPVDSDADIQGITPSMVELVRQLGALPSVRGVAVATEDPFENHFNFSVQIPNRRETVIVSKKGITDGYFSTLGITILQGHSFTSTGSEANNECIVDRRLASLFWPNGDAVGKGLRIGGSRLQVVGVVSEVNFFGRQRYQLFVPAADIWKTESKMIYSHVYLRTDGVVPPETVEHTARALMPRILVAPPVSMQGEIDRYLILPSLAARLALPIALLAVFLSGIGGFGIVSFVALMKKRDMAMRLALGASRASIAYELGKFVAKATLAGLVLGFSAVMLTASFWRQALWNPKILSFTPLIEGIALMLLLMFAATIAPIRRASKVDPLILMRES